MSYKNATITVGNITYTPMHFQAGIFFNNQNKGRLGEISKYLINNEAVVIMFKDGTKTVASVDHEDKFDKELGFCLAMYKYVAKRNKVSKGSYKRELACIKEDKLKDYLVENFDRFTFKNLEKSRKFLKNLKITGKKWAKVN